jgi:hypothetical protein
MPTEQIQGLGETYTAAKRTYDAKLRNIGADPNQIATTHIVNGTYDGKSYTSDPSDNYNQALNDVRRQAGLLGTNNRFLGSQNSETLAVIIRSTNRVEVTRPIQRPSAGPAYGASLTDKFNGRL